MFIFIEDEEWDRADACIETVLDEDPENPYANLGKAMVKAKVASPYSPTEEEIQILKSIKAYSRAKQYADDNLKKVISSWEGYSSVQIAESFQPAEIRDQSGQTYLVEADDGMLVDVPADRLDAWSRAQSQMREDQELTPREKELLDKVLDSMYGREVSNNKKEDSTSDNKTGIPASSAQIDPPISNSGNNKQSKKWKDLYTILIIIFLIALATTTYVVINKQSQNVQISSSLSNKDRYEKALRDIEKGEISGFDEAEYMAREGKITSHQYEKIIEATYQEGVKLYTDGELEKAIPFFEKINPYKKSVAYLTHIYTTLERDK